MQRWHCAFSNATPKAIAYDEVITCFERTNKGIKMQ
jgi:hypothetical protein